MLANLKIKYKLILVPLLATLTFALVLIITQSFGQRNEKLLIEIEAGYVSALELSRDMEFSLSAIQHALQTSVATMNEQELVTADSLYNRISALLDRGRSNPVIDEQSLSRLKRSFDAYYRLARSTSKQMIHGEFNEATVNDIGVMSERYNYIKDLLVANTARDKQKMKAAFDTTRLNYKNSNMFIAAIIVIIILIISLISLFFSRWISGVMKQLVNAAKKLAIGNIDVEIDIDTRDEFGYLAGTFNTLIRNSKDLTTAANAIGKGEYDVEVNVRSEKDVLGNALSAMKTNLMSMSRISEDQNWFKSGQAELNDKMRGEQDIRTLAQNIVNFLASHLDFQIGALYLLEGEDKLKMVASYAYQKRKHLSNEVQLGEGLVGQAALEKKTIQLIKVPTDYISINSGLGEKTPDSIVVTPIIVEDEVVGVIELGMFGLPSELKVQFLEDISENIAINFNAALSRIRLQELLQSTQNQAKELQHQQEELRQANEQLEEQTMALKESESRLQAQQEELRQTNEELEQQTCAQEKQKTILAQRNTELKQAQHLVEEKAQDLERANKYKSEFLANMSHELRTPLNSMLILSKLLAGNKDKNLTDEQIKFSRTIHTAGSDLLNLINDILDLSKVEAGKLELNVESVYINDIIVSLDRQFRQMATEKQLRFRISKNETSPEQILSDQQRIEQVLKNLLSNAFKFTKEGSVTIDIFTPNGEIDYRNKELKSAQTIAFSVNDTGTGIPTDKQNLIFESFQQADGNTNRRFGGTGLGLSISREMSRLLGGEIHLSSKEGQGSTFTLCLPVKVNGSKSDLPQQKINKEVHKESQKPKQEINTKSTKKDNKKRKPAKKNISEEESARRVLIIEDDPIFAQLLCELAEGKDFECIMATEGGEALTLAEKYNPECIISDLGLPDMQGMAVIQKLKENPKTRHIPVHVVSGYEQCEDAYKLGAIGVLAKPVEPEDLEGALDNIQDYISRKVKKLLLVEDNDIERDSIRGLIGNGDVETTEAASGEEALKLLQTNSYDCLVLDLGLSDVDGFDILRKINENKDIKRPPIIVHTGRDLSGEERELLNKYSEKVIIKGEQAADRLLYETTLFLHRVEDNLPEEKQKMLRMYYNKEETLHQKKILLVDDDLRNVFALTHVLEGKGMEVIVGKNGKEGIETLQENPDIDLIIMDMMMPEMDGYEAMRRIRKLEKFIQIPILALTAKAMKGDKEKCIQAGANDYLAKPIDADQLLTLLRVWLYR